MLRIAICFGLALLVGSCRNQSSQEQALYDASGNAKPVVALVPIIDNSKNDLTWSLSDELTGAIHSRLLKKDKLYLVDMEQTHEDTSRLRESNNPFGTDISWMKRTFSKDEFVVFLELIEHEELSIPREKRSAFVDAAAELNISLRVRVVDLRGEKPKIILQELVHDTHQIPRAFTKENFYQVPWQHEAFCISPIGLAHEQFAKEIAARVQDYILLAND